MNINSYNFYKVVNSNIIHINKHWEKNKLNRTVYIETYTIEKTNVLYEHHIKLCLKVLIEEKYIIKELFNMFITSENKIIKKEENYELYRRLEFEGFVYFLSVIENIHINKNKKDE